MLFVIDLTLIVIAHVVSLWTVTNWIVQTTMTLTIVDDDNERGAKRYPIYRHKTTHHAEQSHPTH